MSALVASFIFMLIVSGICFAPGFFLIRSFFQKDAHTFSIWELLIYSFGASMGFLIFGMLLIGKLGILFTPLSLILLFVLGTTALSLLLTVLNHFRAPDPALQKHSFLLSKKQGLLFLLIITSTVFIKTLYLNDTIIPTSTDLGHHMYWAKLSSETGKLPIYKEQNIVQENGRYSITEPEPIADFIIGEHLPFTAIDILTKNGFFSAFPTTFLALINFLALFSLAVFAFYLARGLSSSWQSPKIWSGENAFLLTLFFFGPLYSLASPQEKFVSGGVVGNTFGIFFIPLILLSFYRALKEKDGRFLALGTFFSFTLAYIHHLSSFILAFILLASVLSYLLLNISRLLLIFKEWSKLLLHPLALGMFGFAAAFFFLVAMPTYIETGAVATAVGTPTKTTRIGLTLAQITDSSGESRMALGLVGLALLIALPWRKQHAAALLIGWGSILLTMSLRPNWLFVDIPSNRIGAYLSFPLGLLAVIATLALISLFVKKADASLPVPKGFALLVFTSLFVYALGNGALENAKVLLPASKAEGTVATFHASRFLAEETNNEDLIVKDHNYIVGDAWMKLFFLRDYSFPLSRAFFSRYIDNPDREQCTLSMISVPNTPQGDKCYDETGTNIVVVSSLHDVAQFHLSDDFSKIYTSKYISIFKRQTYAD